MTKFITKLNLNILKLRGFKQTCGYPVPGFDFENQYAWERSHPF